MTTSKNITTEQIEALRNEAGIAGDRRMAAACDRAMSGSAAARVACAKAMRDAEWMRDNLDASGHTIMGRSA